MTTRTDHRPDPERLLASIQRESLRDKRGKLKVFMGMAPGVGKTYAMLQAAHELKSRGVDVVVGLIEDHGRLETRRLVAGLEVLPRKSIDYRDHNLDELDLDRAIARRPALILIDELAHTNAPGSRHPKRYLDVKELIDLGIDVYTTLNIQHLESLNDLVASITGVTVRETVPDSVLEESDAVTLIDLPPEELIARLDAGRIYGPDQSARARKNFFRLENLLALREFALRKMAARVNGDVLAWRRDHHAVAEGHATQHVLVCVSASEHGGRLVRVGSRMADTLHVPWHAVWVDTPSTRPGREKERELVYDHLRLAESLGATTSVLVDDSVADAILRYANDHDIHTVVVGHRRLPIRVATRLLPRSLGNLLAERGENLEIHLVPSDRPRRLLGDIPIPDLTMSRWPWGVLATALTTLFALVVEPLVSETDIVLLYLLGLIGVAWRLPLGASLLTALLSVLCFNFFFVEPNYTLEFVDSRFVTTFMAMTLTGFSLSAMAARVKRQREGSVERERRAAALYEFSRELATTESAEEVAQTTTRHLARVLGAEVTLFLAEDPHAKPSDPTSSAERASRMRLAPTASHGPPLEDRPSLVAARWSLAHGQPAGYGTSTLAGVDATFYPLKTDDEPLGVIGIRMDKRVPLSSPERRDFITAVQYHSAMAIARLRARDAQRRSEIDLEAEQMRASLLSSVSHDLRTPLGTILGSLGALLARDVALDEPARRSLLTSAHAEAERLHRLVKNLLEMTRITSGRIAIQADWQLPEEVVGATLARYSECLDGREVSVTAFSDLCRFDATLIDLALGNLIDNAVKYAPQGPIEVEVTPLNEELRFVVRDRGPGLGPTEGQRIFEKFYRGENAAGSGSGLGLAICRAVASAHGGRVWADNREPGPGAEVGLAIPLIRLESSTLGTLPSVEDEPDAHLDAVVDHDRLDHP